MGIRQQQQYKRNNTDCATSNSIGKEPQGSRTPQSGNRTEEPQAPFTLLQPSENYNSTIELLRSTAVTAEDDTTRRVEQIHRHGIATDSSIGLEKSARVRDELGIPERSEWGPSLSLPDIDDTSMNYTSLYMEHYKVDLLWAILSDSFFILGGISYIALSGWDYYIYKYNVPNDNKWHIAVDLIAPIVYLLNGIIDIHWAVAVRLRSLNQQEMTKIWDEARLQLRGSSFTSSSLSSTLEDSNETDVRFCFGYTWCCQVRKYAAHRRTMMAAFFFGIASSLAVVAAIHRTFILPTFQSDYGNEREISPWIYSVDSILDAVSNQLYIISSIFSMTGKRHRPWFAPSDPHTTFFNDSARLEDLGDLLFFIGSLVDATLSDFQLKRLVLLPILSSILWTIDGCLYMRSDIVKACKLRDEATSSRNDVHSIKFIV